MAEHRLESVRQLSPSAFVIRIERLELPFEPGQYLILGLKGSTNRREYSIYSGQDDPFLEVLVKQVNGGLVSRQLTNLGVGSVIDCEGPYGFFTISEESRNHPLLFVASGTGVAPFHSFVRSYSGLDFQLLHGIRSISETYEETCYPSTRLTVCVSREVPKHGNFFHGRVTSYLRENPIVFGTKCYLCGNSEMIFEVFDMLKGQGIPSSDLFAEVYF